jgi:hemerythrin-like metal-binding protein
MQQDILFSAMSTGVTAIDELNRDFANAMQQVACAAEHAFEEQYRAFVKKAERAFSIEEHWMEEIDCPLLHSHREQHARVLGALHNVHSRVMNGDIALGRDVVGRLLPQWFSFHVATMDVALAAMLAVEKPDVKTPVAEREAAYVD